MKLDNNYEDRLFTEANQFNDISNWKPNNNWYFMLSNEVMLNKKRLRIFNMIETKSKRLFGICLHKHSFFNNFMIYDHNYSNAKNIKIEFIDAILFKTLSEKIVNNNQARTITIIGDIIDSDITSILIKVKNWGNYPLAKKHNNFKGGKYLSLPKSYIVQINGKSANLKRIYPKLTSNILNSKLNPMRLLEYGVQEKKYKKYTFSGIEIPSKQGGSEIWAMFYSFAEKKFCNCYTGDLNSEIIEQKEFYTSTSKKYKLFDA